MPTYLFFKEKPYMSTVTRAGTLDRSWYVPFFADIRICLYILLVAVFATFVIEVGTKEAAGIILKNRIDANHITAICVLSFKMTVKMF